MLKLNETLLRAKIDKEKAKIEALRKDGKVSPEVDELIGDLFRLLSTMMVVLLEKISLKNSNNSSQPKSRSTDDETTGSQGRSSKTSC